MTITASHLRTLLDSGAADPALLLVEGEVRVVAADGRDEYPGAMEVISRSALRNRLGAGEPTDRELAEQAANLDAAITNLGG